MHDADDLKEVITSPLAGYKFHRAYGTAGATAAQISPPTARRKPRHGKVSVKRRFPEKRRRFSPLSIVDSKGGMG